MSNPFPPAPAPSSCDPPTPPPRRKPLLLRALKRFAVYYLLVYAGLAAVAFFFGRGYLYYPTRIPPAPDLRPPAGVEEVFFAAEDKVRLQAWHARTPGARASLLWFHGNGGNLTDRVEELSELRALGLDVLLLSYRGYGKSEGRPFEAGLRRDAEAAWRFLTEDRKVPPSRIILYGQSLGGAVAVDLATRRPAAGLALMSTFTNTRQMAAATLPLFPVGPFLRERYDSLERIRTLKMPLLIQHGEADEIVPFEMGRRLHAAAPGPKFFHPVPRAQHNDVPFVGGAAYHRRLAEFVDFCLDRGPR